MDWYFISLTVFNMPSCRVSVGTDLATSHWRNITHDISCWYQLRTSVELRGMLWPSAWLHLHTDYPKVKPGHLRLVAWFYTCSVTSLHGRIRELASWSHGPEEPLKPKPQFEEDTVISNGYDKNHLLPSKSSVFLVSDYANFNWIASLDMLACYHTRLKGWSLGPLIRLQDKKSYYVLISVPVSSSKQICFSKM